MDLDAFAKGKYALKLLNPGVSVYLKVPLGFSLLAGGGAGTVVPGFNFGILPGVELDLTEHYGMYAELGYMNRVFQGSASHSGSISLGLKVKF
jgi:hypothetical protein